MVEYLDFVTSNDFDSLRMTKTACGEELNEREQNHPRGHSSTNICALFAVSFIIINPAVLLKHKLTGGIFTCDI